MTHRKRHTPRAVVKALDVAAEQIERVTKEAQSKQPRFAIDTDTSNMQALFYQIYGWGKELIFNEPKYSADSRRRDTWLAQAVTKEPYLLGILQSVVSIDKNRGWTLTGGKIQVKRFINVLHNFQVAPDLFGWRPGCSVTSQSFYQSDLGGVVELGRAMDDGPLAALYSVDPTKCRLTGNSATPLQYAPGAMRGGTDYWRGSDYFRVTSFPNPSETVNGLGYCAVSRCADMAKIAVSIFEHYREKLGSKAPKGIMTINGGGITQQQWLKSLEESRLEVSALAREYYTGVQTLVGDRGSRIEVELTPLSNLPDDFDLKTTIDMIIYGYALAFGYDPREFWPVSSGTLGTGRETESQMRKASTKGGLDFALTFQEKLQDELPETIQFEFEQRDVTGDIAETAFQKAKWDIIDSMIKSVNANGEVTFTHAQMMELAVDAKLAKPEWTLPDEDVEVSDTDDMGATADMLTKERVIAAMEKYQDDDIVTYSSDTGKFRTLRKAGAGKVTSAGAWRGWAESNNSVANWTQFEKGAKNVKRIGLDFTEKQTDDVVVKIDGVEVPRNKLLLTFRDGSTVPGDAKVERCCGNCACGSQPVMTRAAVAETIRERREKLKERATSYDTLRQNYWEIVYDSVAGYLESDKPITSYRNAMKQGAATAILEAVEGAYTESGGELPLDEDTGAWLGLIQNQELANIDALFSRLALLRKENDFDPIVEGFNRAEGYASTLDGIYNQGRVYGLKNKMLTFAGEDGEVSCPACQRFKGQRHRASWWLSRDAVPPSGGALDCAAGRRCMHVLQDDDGNIVTV